MSIQYYSIETHFIVIYYFGGAAKKIHAVCTNMESDTRRDGRKERVTGYQLSDFSRKKYVYLYNNMQSLLAI